MFHQEMKFKVLWLHVKCMPLDAPKKQGHIKPFKEHRIGIEPQNPFIVPSHPIPLTRHRNLAYSRF